MPSRRPGGPELDLHRRTADEALRHLRRELHACRVRGVTRLVVVTGLGFGNRRQEPVLRTRVEAWLRGSEARDLGVRSFERVHRGGALEVRLAPPGPPA